MSEPPVEESIAEGAPSDAPETKRGWFGRLWIGLLVGIGLWLALAVAVLIWQPSRPVQLVVIVAAVLAAGFIPRKGGQKFLALAAVLVAIPALLYLPSRLLSTEVEFTIRSAGRESDKQVYLVQTDYGAETDLDPGETFRNQDSPLFWKMNSSDLDGVFKENVGRRVRARVIGIRFADVSAYRNVIHIDAIDAG